MMLLPDQSINLKVPLGRFPAQFVWGAATSAHQIEGATTLDGRSESIWDRFSHTPGKVHNNETGDIACEHYQRWPEDIRLMQELGLNAYRFSIAWPRILPNGRGKVNSAGLDFYDRLVDGLLTAGITPWATLYHWDLPQILEDAGGWPERATAEAFAEYADVISRRLGDRVKHWITLNEPWCSAQLGYGSGEHAPGERDTSKAVQAAHTLLLAHGLAVPILRSNSIDAQVGITLNISHAYAISQDPADLAAASRWDQFFNRWYLDPLYGRGYPEELFERYARHANEPLKAIQARDFEIIAAPTDFLGVNYYNPAFVGHSEADDLLSLRHEPIEDGEFTAMDWLVYPQGLYDLLVRIHREYAPQGLYVTENGAAYADELIVEEDGTLIVDDPQRTRFVAQHLAACKEALLANVPLKGYFAWSLLDNFEWAFGYAKRFGLVYVDYPTQRRVIKESGQWYRCLIAQQPVLSGSPA